MSPPSSLPGTGERVPAVRSKADLLDTDNLQGRGRGRVGAEAGAGVGAEAGAGAEGRGQRAERDGGEGGGTQMGHPSLPRGHLPRTPPCSSTPPSPSHTGHPPLPPPRPALICPSPAVLGLHRHGQDGGRVSLRAPQTLYMRQGGGGRVQIAARGGMPGAARLSVVSVKGAGHTHKNLLSHAHTHARTHACTHTRTPTHTRTHTRTHMHARTHTHTHAHTRMHAHARAHTHTHAHTHTNAHTQKHVILHTRVGGGGGDAERLGF